MSESSRKKVAQMAQAGAKDREIVTELGRRISNEERQQINKDRLVEKLRLVKKRAEGPKSKAEQKRIERQRERSIDRAECADSERRKRLEADPPAWLCHYCPDAMFPAPFSAAHLDIIENCLWSVTNGAGSATAIPRGDGKTTVYFGLSLFLLARRIIRFPVLVNWKHVDASEALSSWLYMLSENEEFGEDYPELCQPFRLSTHPVRLQKLIWSDTETTCGANIKKMQKLIIFPDSIGAIAARSAQGDAKGLYVSLADGTRLRPDFLLFDDAQDPSRADNEAAVRKTTDKLINVFMGMAGPQKRITCATACTVEAENDVSCNFLEFPGWRTVRRSRIEKWPGGSEGGEWVYEKGDARREMWDTWNATRLDEGRDKARDFYTENRVAMCEGMQVLWESRFDPDQDVDAFDAAMFDYFNLGADVFARAQQNRPIKQGVSVYSITADLIKSKTNGLKSWTRPDWSVFSVVAVDVNPSYGLTWSYLAFGPDQRAAVVAYDIEPLAIPGETPVSIMAKAVYEELVKLGQKFATCPIPPESFIFDARGWHMDTALSLGRESVKACGLQAAPCIGFGAKQYRPNHKTRIGNPREQCHIGGDQRGKWVAWNADYWREIAQKAWTGALGAPGSLSICEGSHNEFAEQICRERLIDKAEMGGEMRWEWHTQPGPHDYGDTVAMAYIGAAIAGIGTGIQAQASPAAQKKKRGRRANNYQL